MFTILIPFFSFSQSGQLESVFSQLISHYNSGDFERIFVRLSPAMQKALPLANAVQFFSELQQQAGKITNNELIKIEGENTAIYKTTFERNTFQFQISVDADSKIAGFLVKPFVETTNPKVVNELHNYPKEIAALIFESVKDFPKNTQLSIAVIKSGKVNYYGVKIENSKLIPTENQGKVFEIGSLTKVFTSTVLCELIVAEKVKLEDKINSFYPFLFKNKTEITFERLANHTSGLPRLPVNLDVSNATNPYANYGAKELDFYLSNQLILAKSENNSYDYSNLGAGLLGHTLGLSQNQPFEKLLESLFKKYKMPNSYTSVQNVDAMLVKGLNPEGNEVSNWDFNVLLGGGGILSTTTDLVSFATAQFDAQNKAMALTRKETATVNENMKIGLGWHLLKSKKQNDIIWHNGGTGGYSSSMILDVKNKNGVIILSNVSGLTPQNQKIDELAFALLKLLEK